jgi:hypothetical protein
MQFWSMFLSTLLNIWGPSWTPNETHCSQQGCFTLHGLTFLCLCSIGEV